MLNYDLENTLTDKIVLPVRRLHFDVKHTILETLTE